MAYKEVKLSAEAASALYDSWNANMTAPKKRAKSTLPRKKTSSTKQIKKK